LEDKYVHVSEQNDYVIEIMAKYSKWKTFYSRCDF